MSAATLQMDIPASQAEFEATWEIVPGSTDATWTWVDHTVPYAKTPPVNSSTAGSAIGATLVWSTPVEMKAGDTFYIQANVTSADFNDDERFQIVVGTDKTDLQPFKTSTSSFYVYGERNQTEPKFKIKPADTSADRIFQVTEDGLYYVGVRSWYGSVNYNGAGLCLQSIVVDKAVDYPQRVTGASAKADAGGALSATLSWTWPTKTFSGAPVEGELGARIYRSTSDSKADLYNPESLIGTVEGGMAGEKGEFTDNTVPEAGPYYYYVAPFNNNGENPECTSVSVLKVKWIGEDVKPLNPLNATAVAVDDAVHLTFRNRIEGYNGGYLDPSGFYNYITRVKDGGEPVVVAEHYVAQPGDDGLTLFVDNELDGPGSYVYNIYAGYGEELSAVLKSAAIFAGGAFDVPYAEDFADSNSFSMFTAETSYNGYGWQRSGQNAKMTPGYSSYTDVTASLFTPAVRLAAGKTYRVSVKVWGDPKTSSGGWGWGDDDDYYDEDSEYPFTFMAGKNAKAADAEVLSETVVTGSASSPQTLEAFFAPETGGNYYFGFKTTSTDSKCVYLDDISVEISEVLPASVSDLAMTPGERGAQEAHVSFTVPSTTNAGVPVDAIDSVRVWRHGGEEDMPVEVKVLENPLPGTSESFVDQVPAPGLYSYSAEAYLGGEASDRVQTEAVWIGYDVPKQLSAFNFSISLDKDATPVIGWQPLSGSVCTEHGGYYDASAVSYRVYRIDNVNPETEPLLVGETSDLTFTDVTIHQAEWSQYYYGISVVNGGLEGRRVDSYTKCAGGVVELPFSPDLSDDNYVSVFEGRGFVADGGIVWRNGADNMRADNYAFLPPFHAAASDNQNIMLSLTLSRGSAEYGELLEVYLCTVRIDTPSLKGDQSVDPDAAVIAGADQMTLLKTIPVDALADEPQQNRLDALYSDPGVYRFALRCASDYNRQLTVHGVEIAYDESPAQGVDSVEAVSDSEAEYYTLQGLRVTDPAPGIYIRVSGGRAAKVRVN